MIYSLKFKKAKGGYAVAKATFGEECDVVIPPEFKGEPVVRISAGAFEGCEDITAVTIPATVKAIGDRAFEGCWNLERVTGMEGVETIGSFAFAECSELWSITVHKNVRSIGEYAFMDCDSLIDVRNLSALDMRIGYRGPGEICSNALNVYRDAKDAGRFTETRDGFVFYEYRDEDGERACCLTKYKGDKRDLKLPSSFDGIPSYIIWSGAFLDCERLRSIEIPPAVTEIGGDPFTDSPTLEKVSVGDMRTWLNIRFLDLESNPVFCGAKLYVGGEEVRDVVIPEGTETIGVGAFAGSAIRSVTVPGSVKSIGEGAFACCDRLEAVYVEDLSAWCSVQVCGDETSPLSCEKAVLYVGGKETRDLVIPEGITEVGSFMFADCRSLRSVRLPDGLKTVDEYAFLDCPALSYVVIPRSVERIDHDAFGDDGLEGRPAPDVFFEGNEEEWSRVAMGLDLDKYGDDWKMLFALDGMEDEDPGETGLEKSEVYFYSEEKPEAPGAFWHRGEDGEPVKW